MTMQRKSGSNNNKQNKSAVKQLATIGFALTLLLLPYPSVWASGQESGGQTAATNSQNPTGNTNAMVSSETGVAVNGDVDSSSINSNQTTVTTGSNTNMNVVAPTLLTPTQSLANGGSAAGGAGGSAVLMLPRNPLPLSNAALGRSNFGLQFGLQNYPALGNLGGINSGGSNALGWFLQAGVTIPFGKIPSALTNKQHARIDDLRQQQMARERDVFGTMATQKPAHQNPPVNYNTDVRGKISGMGAYNFTTLPSAKINLPNGLDSLPNLGEIKMTQPRLLALSPSNVYTKPLNVGDKIGVVEVGNEYPYLGHTRSGWVKILLPNGKEGWTSTNFEYIKRDYTEVDELAVDPKARTREKTATIELNIEKKPAKVNTEKRIR